MPEKILPSFVPSGILARYSNTVNGITLKFTEPLDAAPPTHLWQLFPFLGDVDFGISSAHLDPISLNTNSVFLFGRESSICAILLDHRSISSQHSVIQFREVHNNQLESKVKPYLMDLCSTNGTYLNGQKIEEQRYIIPL